MDAALLRALKLSRAGPAARSGVGAHQNELSAPNIDTGAGGLERQGIVVREGSKPDGRDAFAARFTRARSVTGR